MATLTKRRKVIAEGIDPTQQLAIKDALELVKKTATAKFDEGIDVAIRLGIDARKSDQGVRGAVVMPNGTGKSVRVAVFATGDKAEEAKAAGAELVGMEDLAEQIKKGEMNFDVVIAAPDAMRIVGQLGQVLGPRGLMPNPKVGTVSADVAGAVQKAKAGQVRFRNDKNGIIHGGVGKASFTVEALEQNIRALLIDLKKMKPAQAKGTFLKKLVVSSTMGVGISVDMSSVDLK
jgi:large subunit ribosomal protein L1